MANELRVEALSKSKLCIAFLSAGPALMIAGALGGDRMIGTTTGRDLVGGELLSDAVGLLDLISGKEVSNFLLGFILILAALGLNGWRRRRLLSGALLYVGLVQFLTTTIADLSKAIFGRLRPFQAIADGGWSDVWFAGPDYGSFPSGHVAFYFGLCAPIALLRPRYALLLLAVPVLVAIQRMGSHDHYMSDVGVSFLIGALLALALRPVVRKAQDPGAVAVSVVQNEADRPVPQLASKKR